MLFTVEWTLKKLENQLNDWLVLVRLTSGSQDFMKDNSSIYITISATADYYAKQTVYL